jgi:benzoate/toluate 1,2-dioxygenase reductase subunit
MVFAVTNDHDLVALEQLERIAAAHPQFSYVTCVAAGQRASAQGLCPACGTGWMNGGDVDVYLCGPVPMVDAVRGWLADDGVTPPTSI